MRTRKRGPTVSPWLLTVKEAQALDAIVEHCTNDAAAVAMGCAVKTLDTYLYRARERLRTKGGFRPDDLTRTGLLRLWMLWRQGQWTDPLA